MAAQGAWADTQDTRPPSKRAVRRRFALSDLPILLWRERGLILAVFTAVLIYIRHHENIARLLKGAEPKIGAKKA